MNRSPLSPPPPFSAPTVTAEGIICGTDAKYRWVVPPAKCFLPFRSNRCCTLFTMDERCVSSRQVKGRTSKEEIIHAFSVWVGGQSQPALRFHPPKEMALSAVRRILLYPDKTRMVLRFGLNRLPLQTDDVQFDIISGWLSRHCSGAIVTTRH